MEASRNFPSQILLKSPPFRPVPLYCSRLWRLRTGTSTRSSASKKFRQASRPNHHLLRAIPTCPSFCWQSVPLFCSDLSLFFVLEDQDASCPHQPQFLAALKSLRGNGGGRGWSHRIPVFRLREIRGFQLFTDVVNLCLENVEFLSQICVHLFPVHRHKWQIESSCDPNNYSKKESSKRSHGVIV
jgi:hypothetical protein